MADTTETIILELKINDGAGGKSTPEVKKEVEALATSILGLQQANKKLREERKLLDTATAEGSKRIKEINEQLDKNNDIIKENSSALEKQRLNIGNYASALDKLAPGLNKVITGFQGAGKAAMTLVANPIIAGIALIIGMISALGAAYAKSAQGARDLDTASGALKGTFQLLLNDVGSFVEKLIGPGGVTKAIGNVLNVISPLIGYYYQLSVAIEKNTEAFERNKARAEGTGKFYLQLAEINKRIAENEIESDERRIKAANRVIELIKAGEGERRTVLENRLRELGRIEEKTEEQLNEIANLRKELDDLAEETEGRVSPMLAMIQGITKATLDAQKKAAADAKKELDDFIKEVNAINKEYREREEAAVNSLDLLKFESRVKNAKDIKSRVQAEIDLEVQKAMVLLSNTNLTEAERQLILEQSQVNINSIVQKGNDERFKIEEAASEKRRKLEEQDAQAKEQAINSIVDSTQNAADSINSIYDVRAENELKKIEKSIELIDKATKDEIDKVKKLEKDKVITKEESEKRISEIEKKSTARKEEADKQVEKIEQKAFERNKRLSIVQTLIDTYQSAVAAYKAMVGIPYVGPVLAAIAAGVATAAGLAQVAAIKSSTLAEGGRADKRGVFSGPSHAGGGIDYVRSDGKHRINVEGDEAFFVLKKSATREINSLSALNEKHGGVSFGRKTWHAALGGQIETRAVASRSDNTERLVRSVMSNMPPIYVVAQDVAEVNTIDNNIKTRATVI